MNIIERLTAAAELDDFIKIVASIKNNKAGNYLITGVSGSGIEHIISLISLKTERDLLIIHPDRRRAEQLHSNIAALQNLLSASALTIYLPYLDVEPYSESNVHPRISLERALAFSLMSMSNLKILVTTPENLLFPAPPQEQMGEKVMKLQKGSTIKMEDLLISLESSGYNRESITQTPGEYSVRGGIIDLFSPLYLVPIRLEFDGDIIDSIRFYNPSNQISIEKTLSCTIVPVFEFFSKIEQQSNDMSSLKTGSSPDYFNYTKQYHEPNFIFDYLKNPVLIHLDSRTENAIFEETRKSYINRYKLASKSSRESDPPGKLLLQEDRLSSNISQTLNLFISDSGEVRLDNQYEFRIMSILPEPGSTGPENILKKISKDISNGEIVTFFGYDDAKSKVLVNHPGLELFSPLLINLNHRCKNTCKFLIPGAESLDGELPVHQELNKIDVRDKPVIVPIKFSGSYRFEDLYLSFIGSDDLFTLTEPGRTRKSKSFQFSLQDLKEADYVVHYEHGIGLYRGLKTITLNDVAMEFMEIEYAGLETLYLPIDRLDMLNRYVGPEDHKPALDKLGSKKWITKRQRVKKELENMTRILLNLYASRQLIKGHAFATDIALQAEFERIFPYIETEDQLNTIEEVKMDMESVRPMDRLVVGDVGFGKTEVALRAAFKAAIEGKQTAILAPTTILAYQHYRNFKTRLDGFDFKVAMISRLVPKSEQKKLVTKITSGEVDIIIGTHRLLSSDLKFNDLGLLIIDEEQRFGVAHKEKLKMLKHKVDVLTLTATPIPRTLYLSMIGIKKMSLIETPPENRLSVKTDIIRFDDDILREAINRELDREGQVYFVHNNINTIDIMAERLHNLVPGARFSIAHGRMHEADLEKTMLQFINRETDILVSTTIIENGLDIPNVNTLIVNNAHQFGLSQLYQLRGRVGRSSRQAYCYLIVPPYSTLTSDARIRLQKLIEFSRLGSGFRIAAMDMELRGSGDILGKAQSGHIAEVGFDLYCKMLEETVAEMKGENPRSEKKEVTVELQAEIMIPETYIPDTNQRLALYRRVSTVTSIRQLEELNEEIQDRYGKPPKNLDYLLAYGRIKLLAEDLGISQIAREGTKLIFKFEKDTPLGPNSIYRFIVDNIDSQFLPDGILLIPVQSIKTIDLLDITEKVLSDFNTINQKSAV